MSKKLLSEAVVRRFAKLASLAPISERTSHLERPGDDIRKSAPKRGAEATYKKGTHNDAYIKEDAEEEIADEVGLEDDSLPMPDEEAIADLGEPEGGEMSMDMGSREELAMDVINAVADALNIEVDIEADPEAGAEVENEPEVEMDAELEIGNGESELEDEVDEIMEALRGINYVPGKKEIVNEVAKRVAHRLLKAKRAQQDLQEALGNSSAKRKSTRRKKK